MKITKIDGFHIGLPYEHGAPKPLLGSGAVRSAMEAVYIRVETDEGITGWGEAFGFSACAITLVALERMVAPLAVGREAQDIEALMLDLRRRTQSSGLNGPVGFALSGIDIALWDIRGKREGLPVHRLLGRGNKSRVPAYASLLRLTSKEFVERVCRTARQRGYAHIKLHERSVEAVEAARDALGDEVALMLDTNCAFSPADATHLARRLRPYHLDWFEEPLFPPDDYESLARLRGEGIPIAAGENLGSLNEVKRIIAAQALDVVQPDPSKMGGITECWKALQLASSAKLRAEPHTPYYGPALIAGLHLIAAMPGEILAEYFFADLAESPLGSAAIPRDGYLAVPTGPGLGIEVNEDVLRKYRVRS